MGEVKNQEKNTKKEKISILLEDLISLENYTRDLFSFLPLPICFVSPVGVILEVNPAFEKLIESNIENIIGKTIDKLFSSEKIKSLIDEIFINGFIRNKEVFLYTQSKKKLPISVSGTLRKSEEGENIGCFLAFFNLTEIKKKEEELQKELKRVEETRKALINILEDVDEERKKAKNERNKTLAIITNFSDGLLFFNNKNILLLINPEAEKIFNIKAKEVVNKSILELIKNPNFKTLIDLIGKSIKKIVRKELYIRDSLALETSTIPIKTGKIKTGVLVILHNITREKLIEKIKTEFVSVAAHQLRTPLSAIKWTLRMLLDGDLGEITKEQRNFIEKTYNSNERMISLINDLLDITKIEEGRYLYKKELTDFQECVDFNIKNFEDQLKRRNIKLNHKKTKTKLPKTMMDVEKIKLAIHNLIDNAIKYTPPKGEIIISIEYNKKTKEIVFSIEDNGVGIPEDQQSRLFSKFFRGANVIRMETEGSGLGLFIIKNIIEAHG